MPILKKLLVITSCALLYYGCFYLNKFVFDELEFSFGVNWVFIPSGLKLLMVLIAVEDAAIGITLASWMIGLDHYYLDSLLSTLVTGVISGCSPLLARKICLDFLGIDKELVGLSPRSILIMSLVFSILSASLHQLWFLYNNISENFLNSLAVMALGNMLGTALVLSAISIGDRYLVRLFKPSE